MEDPWEKVDSATLAGEPIPEVFDDNFRPDSVETAKSTLFERLPDSSQYLANLEKKLNKIQKKPVPCSSAEKRDLLLSLSGAREGHIERLLNNQLADSISYEDDYEQPLDNFTSTLVRHVTPHLQAVNAGELIELLKADQLEIVNCEETVELENILNSELQ